MTRPRRAGSNAPSAVRASSTLERRLRAHSARPAVPACFVSQSVGDAIAFRRSSNSAKCPLLSSTYVPPWEAAYAGGYSPPTIWPSTRNRSRAVSSCSVAALATGQAPSSTPSRPRLGLRRPSTRPSSTSLRSRDRSRADGDMRLSGALCTEFHAIATWITSAHGPSLASRARTCRPSSLRPPAPALSRSRTCRSIRSISHFVAFEYGSPAINDFHWGETLALSGS
jgi:hypothetical protein